MKDEVKIELIEIASDSSVAECEVTYERNFEKVATAVESDQVKNERSTVEQLAAQQVPANILLASRDRLEQLLPTVKYRQSLLKHQTVRNSALFVNCELCGFVTQFRKNLNKHLKRMHKDLKTEEFQKILCRAIRKEYKFTDSSSKLTNNKTKVPTIPKRFSYKDFVKLYCSQCDVNIKEVDLRDQKCGKCGTKTHLQCLKCNRRYLKNSSMYAHLKSKCGPKEYFQCADCDYQVTSKLRLMYHIERIHRNVVPEDYSNCQKCGKAFKHRLDRQRHERMCGKKPDLQCEFCHFRSKAKRSFAIHVQNHILHPENGDVKVKAGSSNETSVDRVEILDEASVSCVSKETSKTKKSRVQEMIEAYCSKCKRRTKGIPAQGKCFRCATRFMFHCGKCDTSYPIQSELRKHIVRKHIKSQLLKGQQCSNCGEKYVSYEDLQQHQALCGKKPNLRCDHCGFRSKYKSSLVGHMQAQHLDSTDPRFKSCSCQTCGKRFKNNWNLTRHKQYCGKEPNISCDHCSFKTHTKSQLIIHMHRLHMRLFTQEVLKCRVCGKESSNVYTHGVHLKNCGVK